jgi:MFS transporter, ACS family, D-galactonate transporter
MAAENKELKTFAPTLALLVMAILINYVDRGSLSLAVPELKVEWGLSATQLGILLSAFFWTYTALQSVIGWLVDRYGANLVMSLGLFVWSLSTAATGLASGFSMLLALRLLLGIGESVVFPASSKILAGHLSEHSRGFANSLICAAMRWGTAIGTFGGGFILARYGWRATFVVLGLIGLLWLPAWRIWKPAHADAERHIGREGAPSFAAILQVRSFWGAAAGHFSANYLAYFLMTWLPYYLVHERHLSIDSMVGTAGTLYAVDSVCAIATGWISDRCIRGGGSATFVRKWAMGIGFSVAAVALAACAVAGPGTYLACLVVIAVGCGIANANVFAVAQTLAGPRGAGRWVGLQNCIANFAGIFGPALTGIIVDWTGHFEVALAVVALVTLGGGVAWVFVVRQVEETRWQTVLPTVA